MTYDQLPLKKQELVRLIMEHYPNSIETGTVTLAELRALLKTRGTKKLPSHPIWIYGDFQYRTSKRGVYSLPLPKENLLQTSDIIEEPVTQLEPV